MDADSNLVKSGRATGALLGLFFISFFAWIVLSEGGFLQQLSTVSRKFSFSTLALVVLLSFHNYLLRAFRWYLLCHQVRADVTLGTAFVHYLAGFAFGVTPARIGEAVRIQMLKSDCGVPYNRGMSVAIADRVIDLFALILLTLAAAVTLSTDNIWVYLLSALLGLAVVGLLKHPKWISDLIGRSHRMTGKATRLHASLRRSFRVGVALYASRPLILSLVLGLLAWLAECIGFYLILDALDLAIDLPLATLIYASATLVGALSFLPGGLGGFEAVAIVGLNQVGVDSTRSAAIGYCFGGAMALHMARIGIPLSAVASFHGSLGSFHSAEPGSIKPSILVCHGAVDSMVTMDDLSAFKQEMDQAQADYEVLLLDGAKHGFSNPQADINAEKYGLDLGYQQQADAESWSAMLALFERRF